MRNALYVEHACWFFIYLFIYICFTPFIHTLSFSRNISTSSNSYIQLGIEKEEIKMIHTSNNNQATCKNSNTISIINFEIWMTEILMKNIGGVIL